MLVASMAAAEPPIPTREALEERAFLRTLEEQGGRSHASGERPELAPLARRNVADAPVATLRVGLSPTSFAADGSVRAEYDTTAAHHHERVDITATGAFELVDLATGAVVLAARSGESVSLAKTADRGAIAVSGPAGGLGSYPGPLRARPEGDSILIAGSIRRINRIAPLVNGAFPLTPAPYRGELEVLASTADPTRLRLVNVVLLEDYVPGVVVNESLGSFHLEALKAQAIAARGYAAANVGRFADRGFDVDDSTLSQVYRGQSSETPVALEAARGTLGLVLARDGRILPALYSSSMGGHTESNEYVFPSGGYPGTNADPSLRGIHDSSEALAVDLATEEGAQAFYSTVYPAAHEVQPGTSAPLTSLHRWTRTRSAAELLGRLKESFGVPASAQRVREIHALLRGASGRMMQIVVTGDWGATTITGWSDLRRFATAPGASPGGTGSASAPNSPSTCGTTLDATGAVQSAVFYGGGFGHNVGMSQYGAQGRALRGQNALEILSGYYRGAEATTLPLALGPAVHEERFVVPGGRAVLVVEDAGLAALVVQVNERTLVVSLRRGGTTEVDVTHLLRDGPNRVVYLPRGPGTAIASIRLETTTPRPGR